MTRIQITPEDTSWARKALARLEHKHGAPRTLELAAARIRADADHLARWIGPSAAAEVLAGEAHRIVAEAAAEIAAPTPAPGAGPAANRSASDSTASGRRRRRFLTAGRAAAWTVGILAGFALGLGVSGWAIG